MVAKELAGASTRAHEKEVDDRTMAKEAGPQSVPVRMLLHCPACGYERRFRNEFNRANVDLMVVTFKVLDWMTCPKCSEFLENEFVYDL
ncbi:MAG: hypothetical protein Kow0069_15560 [Promethearchaeota archaeon]